MCMTPKDSLSLLQPVQGAGHIENEKTSSNELIAYSGLEKARYGPTATPHLDEKQNLQVTAWYFSSFLQTVPLNLDRFAVMHSECTLQYWKD